jgi:Reverse transcriptase (RNA-dependent DNA polymerase)
MYELVDCPPGHKPVGTKWVYRCKRNENGEVIRLKARVVAQGYTQVPGVDFLETHTPVVSITVLRALLNIAAIRDWEVHQVNVDLAYLNSNVDQEL